jgi:hypothetical protein
MQQNDDVVAGWLSGSDSIDGLENPAGPLYIEGEATTEAALTHQGMKATRLACGSFLVGRSTCSIGGGCACC